MRWLLASLVLAAAYFWVATSPPSAVGLWQDDAVYLATARSLADGSGYRHIEIPGEPLQTKYPILYPGLLSIAFWVGPEYPANLPLLLLPGSLMAGGFVVLAGLYLWRVLGASPAWALAAGGLAALSPEILSLVRFTMSDLVYAALAVLALFCLDWPPAPSGSDPHRRLRLVAAGVLIGAAILTRSFGFTLAAAALLTLLLRKRFSDALLLGVVLAALILPWWWWQSGAAAANGSLQLSTEAGYDLRYGLWIPGDPLALMRVAGQNFFRTLFGLGFFQLSLPRAWGMAALSSDSWSNLGLHGVCYAAAGLMCAGFITSLRRRPLTLHSYAALYAGAMLLWPFEPYRFLVAWTPFLLYFVLMGLRAASAALADRVPARPRIRRWIEVPAALLCGAIALGFVGEDAQILASSDAKYYLLRTHHDLRDRDELATWLRSHTVAGQILASNDTGDLFLATGRQVRDTNPGVDPVSIFYGADRSWRSFYALPVAGETTTLVRSVLPRLEDLFAGTNIRFYIERGSDRTSAAMRRFREIHPSRFRRVFSTRNQTYRVFAVSGIPDRESEP